MFVSIAFVIGGKQAMITQVSHSFAEVLAWLKIIMYFLRLLNNLSFKHKYIDKV